MLKEYEAMAEQGHCPRTWKNNWPKFKSRRPFPDRKASQEVVNALAAFLPQLYGGSADLSSSDMTMLKKYPLVVPGQFFGRNIKYGVREFGMAAIATGLQQTGMIVPFIGTFLTFSDYMRNAIRLAALQKAQVIYQFTHDSIFLGEDGPTHQPVEHYASLRAIPQSANHPPGRQPEVAWLGSLLALSRADAIILSRQNLPDLEGTKVPYAEGVGRGAISLKKKNPSRTLHLLATGSELYLALRCREEFGKDGQIGRVISMPCWELFEAQDEGYKESVIEGRS